MILPVGVTFHFGCFTTLDGQVPKKAITNRLLIYNMFLNK